MRFLHTADWHIGRYFFNASLLDDQQHALEQIVALAVGNNVDAVLVAGDIYDRAIPPAAAVDLLDHVLHQLCIEHDIPVILIAGNHDSAQRLGFGSRHLQQAGLHIISELTNIATPVVVTSGSETAHVYGIPYAEPVEVNSTAGESLSTHAEANRWLLEQIVPSCDESVCNIVLAHCFVTGGTESDSEKRLSVGGADNVDWEPFDRFDYAALGHLHAPQHRVRETIRYAGSPLKYSFSECSHRKSVSLVETAGGQVTDITELSIHARRDVRVIEGEFDQLIAAAKEDRQREDYLLVRILDKGPILNAMAQLREYYPNVLHLEKPGLLHDGQPANNQRYGDNTDDVLKRDELTLFEDFFTQVTGDKLTDTQREVLEATINTVKSAEQADS